MKKVFVVGGESFGTKSKIIERVQGIVAAYADFVPLQSQDFAFVRDLVNGHPNAYTKIGAGVGSIYIRENPLFPGKRSRGFVICRIDGTFTDFSYRECITPSSQAKKVKAAFRNEIQDQCLAFKQAHFDSNYGVSVCPDTGEEINFLSSHVDHVRPTDFDSLLALFLESENLSMNEIGLTDGTRDNIYSDYLASDKLRARWADFHKNHAVLQVVSKRANLSNRKHGDVPHSADK